MLWEDGMLRELPSDLFVLQGDFSVAVSTTVLTGTARSLIDRHGASAGHYVDERASTALEDRDHVSFTKWAVVRTVVARQLANASSPTA
jgi:hypothetical protein